MHNSAGLKNSNNVQKYMPQCLKHVYPIYKHVKLVRMVWFWQSAMSRTLLCNDFSKQSLKWDVSNKNASYHDLKLRLPVSSSLFI